MFRLSARSGASTLVPIAGPRPQTERHFARCRNVAKRGVNQDHCGHSRQCKRHIASSRSLHSDAAQQLNAYQDDGPSSEHVSGGNLLAHKAVGGALNHAAATNELWKEKHNEGLALRPDTNGRSAPRSRSSAIRRNLFAALDSGDAVRLLDAAVVAFRHDEVVSSLSQSTIHEVFRSLDLDNVIKRYHEISQQLRPGAIHKAIKAGSPARQVSHALEYFQDSFAKLVQSWQRNAQDVSMPIFKTLLRLAALLGDGDTARTLRLMMKRLGHQLDVESTNSFIRALCWNKSYGNNYPLTRVVAHKKPGTVSWRTPEYALSIKNEVLEAIDEMIAQGFVANAETHSLLAVAMGRMGDLHGVGNILKAMWNIDLSEVKTGSMDATPGKSDLQPGDLLYPSEEVLFNLVHVYSTNNSFSDALVLVDHIARRYAIKIPQRVWEELTLRAFILSTPRSLNAEQPWKQERDMAFNEGHISPKTMESLWKTMTSPPYNVTPSLSMWDWRLKCLYRLRRNPHIWMKQFESLVYRFKLYEVSWPVSTSSAAVARTKSRRGQTTNAIQSELALFDELIRAEFTYKWIRHHLRVNHIIANPHWMIYKQIPAVIGRYLKIWFQCTRRALRYSTLTGRVNFHDDMASPNVGTFETFQSGKFRISRPAENSLRLPYVDQTPAQRAVELLDRRGIGGADKWRREWFEADLQDWIWFQDGTGKLISGAPPLATSPAYSPPSGALSGLTPQQRESLEERAKDLAGDQPGVVAWQPLGKYVQDTS